MSFYIGRESSKVWFGLFFFIFWLIILALIGFLLCQEIVDSLVLMIDFLFFIFWFCEAMEETLRRDNNRAQPSCRELEVSSRRNCLSGLLFWFICFRKILDLLTAKESALFYLILILILIWFEFWLYIKCHLSSFFDFGFCFWWRINLEVVSFPTLYENPMTFLAINLLKLELIKGYNHGWLVSFTLRKDLCFWQKIKLLPALIGGHT